MLAHGPVEALYGGLWQGLPVPEGGLCPHKELHTGGRETLCAEKETVFLAALCGAFL